MTEIELRASLVHHSIPSHMHEAVVMYILLGHPTGDFLRAVFSDMLVQAFARADDKNTAAMRCWASFLYEVVPSEARGSPESVDKWIARGGLKGRPQ